jgi:outer membrane protein OmpA-like peptidoglycan-associated protein
MKLTSALGASFLLLCAALSGLGGAAAQVYPGEEVTVNPAALGHGYLLYPGGKYGRAVGTLLQPGERRRDLGVVHLHMPVKHPRVARAPRPAAPATIDNLTTTDTPVAAAAPPPPPPKPHKTPPQRTAAAQPPVAAPPRAAGDINSLPEDSAARLLGDPGASAAPPPKPAKPAPPRRTASATPPPADTTAPVAVDAGLRKQSVIPFAAGASSPASADVNAIHALATSLNAMLGGASSRVQLQAYGGPRGDKSSDSRRLSLRRALVVRELLIEDGVPSEKIDVRAMGGADDNGAADRVDVYVRA